MVARRARSRPLKAIRDERGLGLTVEGGRAATPWGESDEASVLTGARCTRSETGFVGVQAVASSRDVREGLEGRAATLV
ncbi:hypothetical protein CYMTET_30004 [Cymbomonas tetramitiformis]|uniref:Uncharacterized protein n=1 Tax=Cymbomonas tetramitiformis TaxID=36881 RepID=A0AAE0KUC9_9CHLO|nr:hypothetical protein CYMTET_30004 [Cymbomonas tetramitiformis]